MATYLKKILMGYEERRCCTNYPCN